MPTTSASGGPASHASLAWCENQQKLLPAPPSGAKNRSEQRRIDGPHAIRREGDSASSDPAELVPSSESGQPPAMGLASIAQLPDALRRQVRQLAELYQQQQAELERREKDLDRREAEFVQRQQGALAERDEPALAPEPNEVDASPAAPSHEEHLADSSSQLAHGWALLRQARLDFQRQRKRWQQEAELTRREQATELRSRRQWLKLREEALTLGRDRLDAKQAELSRLEDQLSERLGRLAEARVFVEQVRIGLSETDAAPLAPRLQRARSEWQAAQAQQEAIRAERIREGYRLAETLRQLKDDVERQGEQLQDEWRTMQANATKARQELDRGREELARQWQLLEQERSRLER